MAKDPLRIVTNKPKNNKKIVYTIMGTLFLVFSGLVYLEDVPEIHTKAPAPQVAHGKMLWQKHNCSSCHQLYGLGGYLGPDLTNSLSQKGKGRQFAAAIMKTGTQVMPDFKLQDQEIEALLAFLEHTDKSGRGSVHDYIMEPDGSITPVVKEEAGL
ncbi:MAG TPA: cytochrome c [Adhaeribacter sp.]|nr:cytochrome c [Adhaeribacter sp.]